ncbi:hypothetical protein PHSY_003193 [Pseudozyma hubeiensis SY62]|uniref:Uncharacterized protein n=1 Tax=Pseudozyma hubeiensis (strain SY62) TaxID=1305764 RepID=R9P2Y6_PSEHS|nr:hypothetical protein PHSY_003193 [Pseudozyma hubeiensis SY62]GAC95617.1 hypothetical protein PHSY_003193 [Pseudozyma hubeiensis SY62]
MPIPQMPLIVSFALNRLRQVPTCLVARGIASLQKNCSQKSKSRCAYITSAEASTSPTSAAQSQDRSTDDEDGRAATEKCEGCEGCKPSRHRGGLYRKNDGYGSFRVSGETAPYS